MGEVYFVNAGMPGVAAVGRNGSELGLWVYCGGYVPKVEKEDYIIWGAWSDSYYRAIRQHRCKQARFVTSSLGQMEMEPVELEWLQYDFKLLEKGDLDNIFFGSPDLAMLHKKREGVKYCPYPVTFNPKPFDLASKEDATGIFLPNHKRKNIQNQLAAIELLPAAYRKKYTNLRGWMLEEQYRSLLSKVRVVMHATHCESFGYAVIEAIEAGTLPLISPCVRHNLNLTAAPMAWNLDSPVHISQKLLEVLTLDQDEYERIIKLCVQDIQRLKAGKDKILDLLTSVME